MSGTPTMGANWKTRGGLLKMVGFIFEGIGLLISAGAVISLASSINSGSAPSSTFTQFLDFLGVGIAIAALGVIVIGVGLFLESLHH